MANFRAAIRTKLRDIDGLVLSCRRDDIDADINNPGFARRWLNRAPGLPSQPQYRDPGDVVTYAGGRFGDPHQLIAARQPAIVLTGGGQKRVEFDRTTQQFFDVEIPAQLALDPGGLTVGYQFTKGSNAANSQVIFDDGGQGQLAVTRRNGGGLARIAIGGAAAFGPATDHPDGVSIAYGDGATALDWRYQNTALAAAVAANTSQFTPGAGFVGRDTGGNYLDGILDCIHVWMRTLSPLERDFAWQLISEDGIAYNTDVRATMTVRLWTDVTGDLAQGQINRLRSAIGADPHYKFASIINGGAPARRIQIAASVDGLVLPDADLGGDLFTLDWLEVPGGPPQYPPVVQTPGWSAVLCFGPSQWLR